MEEKKKLREPGQGNCRKWMIAPSAKKACEENQEKNPTDPVCQDCPWKKQ